jgi:hypothetical protein
MVKFHPPVEEPNHVKHPLHFIADSQKPGSRSLSDWGVGTGLKQVAVRPTVVIFLELLTPPASRSYAKPTVKLLLVA